MKFGFIAAAAALSITGTAFASEIVVTSPVGSFTNADPVNNASGPGAGLDTWYANNVRANGVVGISDTYARNGNGSVQFSGPAGAKADFEYYFSAPNQFLLSDLTALSYDFLRSSTSTAASHLHPSLRLAVTDGQVGGYLVYEGIYNNATPFQSDVFVSVDVLPTKIWGTNSLPGAFSNYNRTAADWATLLPNLKVVGLSFGIGSGWNGTFDGAVDNVTFGVNGVSTTYNFETEAADVPEPAMLGLFGLGAIGLGLARRRRA